MCPRARSVCNSSCREQEYVSFVHCTFPQVLHFAVIQRYGVMHQNFYTVQILQYVHFAVSSARSLVLFNLLILTFVKLLEG